MIEYLKIEGFKSIKKMELPLNPINILIGSNGSGKSNFVSFFKLIASIFERRFQQYVAEEKPDNILYFGRKTTEHLNAKIIFSNDDGDNNAYNFSLSQTNEGGLYIGYEGSGFNVSVSDDSHNYFYERNIQESEYAKSDWKRHKFLQEYVASLQVFHFHDTSSTSLLRRGCDINDNRFLRQDGRNLPAFLYLLKERQPKVYNRILKTIQSVAPYIDRFIIEPSLLNPREIELRWVDKGDPQSNFSAYQFSDGTLRFIALTTLLLQPDPPEVIIIDEPELGLHPFAINKLAGMIRVASSKTQIIISTQSVNLIDNFQPEDVITVDRSEEQNQSIFHRLDNDVLKLWLEEFKLGELWQRNIINSAQPFSK
ncbi:MAG: hypothetical protein EOO08_12200 [Chitinophagaceae bacterium]|nr:MAG: hypothetical protein EOO08_12200 [Chitinophagaceae bacterium]